MKERRIVKHERALRDLEARSEYIRQHSPRAALRFLDAAEATFRLLAAQPGAGAQYDCEQPALAGIRFLPIIRHKNDLVFYLQGVNEIAVLRVLHGAQDIHRILSDQFGMTDEAQPSKEE